MTTPSPPAPATARLLPQILERIAASYPLEIAEPMGAFARAYLRRLSDHEVAGRPPDQLFANVRHLYEFADERLDETALVRAFSPTVATHGYVTDGSVVEVSAGDSPFLIDSVIDEIQRHGCGVVRVIHPVIGVRRNEQGRIVEVMHAREADQRESIQHYEIDRRLDPEDLEELAAGVRKVLGDVRRAVRDFGAMQQRVDRMVELARAGAAAYPPEEVDEAAAFLQWLLDDNFVFLGYREYDIIETGDGPAMSVDHDSGLGILSDPEGSTYHEPVPLSKVSSQIRSRMLGGHLVVVTKTNRPSTVHRRVRMDYVSVRKISPDGKPAGEARMLGLFTHQAYMEPASRIPILRRKLARLLAAEDVVEGSHDYRQIIQHFEGFPKDELFSSPLEDLRASMVGLVELEETTRVRVFVRRDLLERSVAVMVAMPRERFNTQLRQRIQDLFLKEFRGSSIEYNLALGESDLAQIHFTIWVTEGTIPEVSVADLEGKVVSLTRSWEDRLLDLLDDRVGPDRALQLVGHWASRFPDYYRSATSLAIAAGDVEMLQRLEDGPERFAIGVQNESGQTENLTRVSLYRLDGKVELSQFVPLLENLGLRVVEEVPTRVLGGEGSTFIHDFGVLDAGGRALVVDEVGWRVRAALAAAWRGDTESDGLARLILTAGIDHRQVEILRAYLTYWRRVRQVFTVAYVHSVLAAHPEMAALLVRFFEARFDPDAVEDPGPIRAAILEGLDAIPSLDEDRILRSFLGLIEATVRTNVYRPGTAVLSFKFRSSDVPDMPLPHPLYEIFVYGRGVEGIHLRGGMVARGGIRWSDRREDYRTEVLGLMKAQVTKNAVIVPTGAKGGFILRNPPADRADLASVVRNEYAAFVRGLLDVTDNLVTGKVIHPSGVKVLDGDDPYLVVAADKGTATFSDLANEVAAEYGLWLGDAFASGGSAGYDHKALGITARGAWESVKRHLGELGIDPAADPFTVVGIGDMSGDVFGNGMLLSDRIRLVAAFDHRHIFIDPVPDPESGIAERRRLFDLPGSSWADYDPAQISPGGGVYPRTSKRIELTAEARAALATDRSEFTPNELISAILEAPVDVLWNGGIGTYVRATTETNEQVGDRSNDGLRVTGRDLRCRVVGEGGNLGLTQLGRIEYDRAGGHIYADFIDNSAGVHCSDREVNLKILLGLAEERGEITHAQRDALVARVSQDVTERIVYDNFLQAQILSQEASSSAGRLEAFEDLMVALEADIGLDRAIEYLPTSDDMLERSRNGVGMARPELSVLLAYAKRSLTDALLDSDLPDDPSFHDELQGYFPAAVVERFGHLVPDHPLRRELIATIVANELVNNEGITFVSRVSAETGAEEASIARAYRLARTLTEARERWADVEALIGSLDPTVVGRLMAGVDQLVEDTTRRLIARRILSCDDPAMCEAFSRLADLIVDAGSATWKATRQARAQELLAVGVPSNVAHRHAFQDELVHGIDIIELSRSSGRSLEEVAGVFFLVGEVFQLDRIEELAARLSTANRWRRLAVQAVDDDLLVLRRDLAQRVMAAWPGGGVSEAVYGFRDARPDAASRLARFMRTLEREAGDQVAPLTVAVRQIRMLFL